MWVLGIKPGTSAGTANALNHQAIFPAPQYMVGHVLDVFLYKSYLISQCLIFSACKMGVSHHFPPIAAGESHEAVMVPRNK